MTSEEIIKAVSDIGSYILDDDICIYNKYVSGLDSGSLILDAGAGWGKSVIAMALSNPKVLIDTFDIGQHQIYTKWAEDEKDYIKKINNQFSLHGANNIRFRLKDIRQLSLTDNYDLIHLDIDAYLEAEILERWWPNLKVDGIFLIRNYKRFKDRADLVLKDKCEYLEHKGLIQVVKKHG